MGICPTCNSKPKVFFDKKTNTKFEVKVIDTKLLKAHSCTGSNEIEYTCKVCGLKEVYSQVL